MKDLLESVLKQHDEKRAVRRVISVTKTNAVPDGENHMSQVSRLAVEVESPTGKRTTRWLILKELPEEPACRAYITDIGLFVKELTCYRDILTVYEDLLKEEGYPDEIPWPNCINIDPYSRIIIEDLKPSGYKMGNKFDGLDLDHCILVMQSLGFFHALSFLAKERRPLPLDVFSWNYTFGSKIAPFEFKATLEKLLPVLKSLGPEWDIAAGKIRDLIPSVVEKLKATLPLPRDENSLYVLNRGDCWTNNFIFKYDHYSGKPTEVKHFDFQLPFYHTPAFDLVHFLALSPELNVRRFHIDQLINIYHESLTLNMNMLRVAAATPSLNTIRDEVNRLGLFKLFLVLMMAPRIIGLNRESEPFNFEEYLKKLPEVLESGAVDDMPWLDFENEGFRANIEATLKEAVENDTLK